jgi:hypothetical protein
VSLTIFCVAVASITVLLGSHAAIVNTRNLSRLVANAEVFSRGLQDLAAALKEWLKVLRF